MTSPSWFIKPLSNWPEATQIHDGCMSPAYYQELLSTIFKNNLYTCLFCFCCPGSPLLWAAFLWLQRVGLLSSCTAWASPGCGFPCCGALAPGTQASEAMAHRLSCSTACGLFPDQGLNRSHLHWQVDSYPLNHQGCPWVLLRTENVSKVFSGKQKCL